jgi:cbb3-type cytochrome oxidase subunit 3
VTDQDKISRFADGEPVGPLNKPRRPRPSWRVLVEIAFGWGLVLAVIAGMIYILFALISERRAHADESVMHVFEVDGECYIDANLRVIGDKRAACVDKLETAARLAKAEMRVNEHRKK